MLVRNLLRGFSTQTGKTQVVGVVGAGQIGAACARGLLRHGYDVLVHDPSDRNRKGLEDLGAKWAVELKDIGSPDVLVTALPAPPHVRGVMEEQGVLDKLQPGSLWIDHTTTDPKEALRLHTKAKERGVDSLEAPLTGGYELLCAGMMTVLVGGEEDIFAKASPLMKSYTETLLHMGGLGQASVVKIITNQLAAVHLIAAGEATMMAKKSGVDLEKFFNGVRASAGNSYVFETETPLFFNDSYDPGFTIDLHIKDLNIGRGIHEQHVKDHDNMYKLHALAESIYKSTMAQYGPKVGSSYPAKQLADDPQDGASLAYPGFQHWRYSIEKVTGGSIGVVHHTNDRKNN